MWCHIRLPELTLYPVSMYPFSPSFNCISHLLSWWSQKKECWAQSRSSKWPKQNTRWFLSDRTYITHESIFLAHQPEASLTNVHRMSSHLNCPNGWSTTWQMSSMGRWTSSSWSYSRWNTASYVSDIYNPNMKNMGCFCLHSRMSCWRSSWRFPHANSHCNLSHFRAWPQQRNSGLE